MTWFEENAHTEARDAGEMCWVKEARVPNSDAIPLGFLCLDERTRDDICLHKRKKHTTLPWGRGHRPPVLLLALRQASHSPFFFLHGHIQPCCRRHVQKLPVACTEKHSLLQQCHRLIDRGSDRGGSNGLLVDLQRSTAFGAHCKRRRRFRPAVAITLPVCSHTCLAR